MQPAPRGALDIGSNTVRLLVARPAKRSVRPLLDKGAFVRLGYGVDETGVLQPERVDAALRAIGDLAGEADAAGTDRLHIVATSAVRDAANGKEFVERVRRQSGIDVEVLSGEREGELTYLGATLGLSLRGESVVIDLGGRSTEVVAAHRNAIQSVHSLPIGSGRLTDACVRHDPPRKRELGDVEEVVDAFLHALPRLRPHNVILTGGTARQIARVLKTQELPATLDRKGVRKALSIVDGKRALEISRVFGIRPERAEVLPAGFQVIQTILDHFRPEVVIVTRQGIREGVIVDSFRSEGLWLAA